MDYNLFIPCIIAIGFCSFLLYTRSFSWAKPALRWIVCGVLFIYGLFRFYYKSETQVDDFMLNWCLCMPLFYYSIDRFFRFLSFKIYNRDFILWLKNSPEIDDSWGAKNPHVKAFDIVFSVSLLVVIIGGMLVGAII